MYRSIDQHSSSGGESPAVVEDCSDQESPNLPRSTGAVPSAQRSTCGPNLADLSSSTQYIPTDEGQDATQPSIDEDATIPVDLPTSSQKTFRRVDPVNQLAGSSRSQRIVKFLGEGSIVSPSLFAHEGCPAHRPSMYLPVYRSTFFPPYNDVLSVNFRDDMLVVSTGESTAEDHAAETQTPQRSFSSARPGSQVARSLFYGQMSNPVSAFVSSHAVVEPNRQSRGTQTKLCGFERSVLPAREILEEEEELVVLSTPLRSTKLRTIQEEGVAKFTTKSATKSATKFGEEDQGLSTELVGKHVLLFVPIYLDLACLFCRFWLVLNLS